MSKSTDLRTDIEKSPVTLYLANLQSDRSKRVMRSSLKQVIATALGVPTRQVDPAQVFTFPWHSVDSDKLLATRAALMKRYEPRGASRCLSAVRAVLGCCFDLGLIDVERWKRIQRVRGIPTPHDDLARTGRRLKPAEIERLIETCEAEATPFTHRDIAILGLGLLAGLRISEVANLQAQNYDPETGDIKIVKGKGRKDRMVRANADLRPHIDAWIEYRDKKRGSMFDYSSAGIQKILHRRCDQAGIKNVSFHDLRRTFISNMLDAGVPNIDVQRFAGHASADTTARYYRGDIETALSKCDAVSFQS